LLDRICLEYFSIDAIIGYDFILLFYPVIAFFVLLMDAEILSVENDTSQQRNRYLEEL